MKSEKISFFNVKLKINKLLSWALGLFLCFEALIEAGDFVGLTNSSSGSLAYLLSLFSQNPVLHLLCMLITTASLLFIFEWFRRSLSKRKSIISYVVLAIMTLMACDFLVSLVPDGSHNILQQIQHPTNFSSFVSRFKNVSSGIQSILMLIMSIPLLVKYKGRIAAYGWSNIICMPISGVGMGYLYMFLYNHNVSFMNSGLAFAWVFFRYLIGIIPVVFLRRTLVYNTIQETTDDL